MRNFRLMPIVLKRIRRILVCQMLLGCLCLAMATIRAQYQIKSWTTDDGLPQNTVYSIAQTSDGYLWMTTLDGLVRFDGVRFTVFNKQNTPGIESNRLKKLILDDGGDLWIGAEANYGNNILDESNLIVYYYSYGTKNTSRSNHFL